MTTDHTLELEGTSMTLPQLVEHVLHKRLAQAAAQDMVVLDPRATDRFQVCEMHPTSEVRSSVWFCKPVEGSGGFVAYRRASPPRLLQALQEATFKVPCPNCRTLQFNSHMLQDEDDWCDSCLFCKGHAKVSTGKPAGWI